MGRRPLAQLFIGVVMTVMVAASLLKASDVSEFRGALESSWGVGPTWAETLAILIPACEMGVAAAWFIGVRRGLAVMGAGVLLILFTCAFIWLWAVRSPPRCACFGKIKMFQDAQHAAMWVVARNTGLLLLLITGAWMRRSGAEGPHGRQIGDPDVAPGFHAH